MAVISKGITLYRNDTPLKDLQDIPDLGGNKDAIEITTLADEAHTYIDGLENYGDSIPFTFLYEATQFTSLQESLPNDTWKVELPDKTTCSFGGKGSVTLNAVAPNGVLTYKLSIRPNTKMTWGKATA